MNPHRKYAIVTGAASGMGRCYACQLAGKGYGILLVDIKEDAMRELSLLLIHQYDVPAPVLCMDLTYPGAASRIANLCRESGWRVEILINNAGILVTSSVEDADSDMLQRIVSLHCSAPVSLCHQIIPLMREHGGGFILNVSSVTAWMDWPVIGIYGCTKRFVKGFSRELRLELGGSSISVTTAFFGAVDTPLLTGLSFMRFRKLAMKLGFMISPEKAARLALNAMFNRRAELFPCFSDRVIAILCPLMPDFLLRFLAKKIKVR